MNTPADMIINIDFDWTLFDTTAFGDDLWRTLADLSGRSFETVKADSGHFHVDPVLGGYKFENHIAAYGLDSDATWAKLTTMVTDTDYLYNDSTAFVQDLQTAGFQPRILSFGEDRFQTAKIRPNLQKLTASQLPFDVIFRKKGPYIAERYAGLHGVLIDDVPNQNLPVGFIEITLDRPAQLAAARRTASGYVVSSLEQALQVINALAAAKHDTPVVSRRFRTAFGV